MGNKGYIFTISVFLLLTSILTLAVFFSASVDKIDISGPKLSALYDDIRTDVFEILDVSPSVANYEGEYGYNLTNVTIMDSLPDNSIAPTLSLYENYVELNYSKHVGQQLDSREGSLAGADIEMFLDDFALNIMPFGYIYTYNNLSKNEVYVYPARSASKLLGLAINISLGSEIINESDSFHSGDLPVRMYIHHQNNNATRYVKSRSVSTNLTSLINIVTADGNVSVHLGGNDVRGDWKNTSLAIFALDNATLDLSLTLTFNRSSPVVVNTPYYAEITDITGKTWLNKTIWFIKE
jgi:hypothetical protein